MTDKVEVPLNFLKELRHELIGVTGLKGFDNRSERVVASGLKKYNDKSSSDGLDFEIVDKTYSVPFDEIIDLDFTDLISVLDEVIK